MSIITLVIIVIFVIIISIVASVSIVFIVDFVVIIIIIIIVTVSIVIISDVVDINMVIIVVNKVKLHWARLVPRWVTMSGFNSQCQTFILVCNQPPRPTQPSIPSGSVNEYQLRLGRQRQVWFIALADECGVCR